MGSVATCDEDLVRRLPLPLARLYRRAFNAKNAQDRHQSAYFLWEAALKLLGSVAIVAYTEGDRRTKELDLVLERLARPTVGHWWEFVRLLVPVLAEGAGGDAGFLVVRDLVLGRARTDMPRCNQLDADLRGVAEGSPDLRGTVRLSELFDRMVNYRNRELGHGAAGLRSTEFYERMSGSILGGMEELLARLDCLGGRRLLYIDDVRRQPNGHWLVERFELKAETARRIESLERVEHDAHRLPVPQRVYLDVPGFELAVVGDLGPKEFPAVLERLPRSSVHPLLIYDPDMGEVLFLNARRNQQQTEYLCYTRGVHAQRKDIQGDQHEFLARIVGGKVDSTWVRNKAAESIAEEAEPAAKPGDDPARPEPPIAPAPSRRIGEFELLSELGRGNMGIVYRAWQPSIGRQVALKCTLQIGDPKALRRFDREILALGRAEHAHLVKIYTKGVENDQCYFAMELIEGATLSAVSDMLQSRSPSAAAVDISTWQDCLHSACEQVRLTEKPLSDSKFKSPAPVPVAATAPEGLPAAFRTDLLVRRGYVKHIVELVRQVAEAAHALHEAGVIHRDIKPANIMVSGDGEEAVLMDLGLAQLMDDAQGKLTRTRQFVGSLRYASPEQVLAVGNLDRRSDVYSLGATLWELLTLRPIYDADEHVAPPELMRRVTTDEPERLCKLHPGISRDLEAIVSKCLEKKPDHRYPTAAELARDLERFLANELVQARSVGPLGRGLKWVQRRPKDAALAGLTLVAAVLFVGWYLNHLVGKERARAERGFEVARQAIDRLIVTSESQLGAEDSMQPLRKKYLEIALDYNQKVSDVLADDAKHSAELATAVSKVPEIVMKIKPKGEVEAAYRKAIGTLEGLARHYPRNLDFPAALAHNHHELGVFYFEAGQLREALQSYQDGLTLRQTLVRDYPGNPRYQTGLARSYGYIGDVYLENGDLNDAEAAYQESHKYRLAIVQADPDRRDLLFQLARSYGNRARLFRVEGQLPRAIGESQQAIAIQKRLVSGQATEEEPAPTPEDCREDLGNSFRTVGQLERESGRLETALQWVGDARTLFEELRTSKPGVSRYRIALGSTLVDLGELLRLTGRNKTALAETCRAADGVFQTLQGDPSHSFELRNARARYALLRGRLRADEGKWAEAETSFQVAIALQTKLVAENPNRHDVHDDLGEMYYHTGLVLQRLDRPAALRGMMRAAVAEAGIARAKASRLLLYSQRFQGYSDALALLERDPSARIEEVAIGGR